MKNNLKKIYLFLFLIFLILGFIYLGKKLNWFVHYDDTAISDFVEINNYQGKDFSKLSDFRENSINGPQYVDINNYQLKVSGLVETPLNLKYSEVTQDFASHKKIARLNCVEGWSVNILWEGILLSDLLKKAGIKPEAKTVIFKAVDGYSTSLPLDYIVNNKIIMAYKMNNEVMIPERGFPFQLVAESKWGYKWIKWISEIELSADENYQGFWESRGYSDSGDLDKPKLK